MDDAVAVSMIHVFEVDHDVVLRSHVICDVVIHDQSQQTIQESQVDFLVHLLESWL